MNYIELKKMQAKYDNIPIECQVEPTSYIALKGVNELGYALEEEHPKEMFENLFLLKYVFLNSFIIKH